MTSRPGALVALAAAAALSLAACGSASTAASPSGQDAAPLSVVAAFYPLQYAAEQVGGSGVSVTNLTPPGAEPHDLELTAQQVAAISTADLVLYIKGFMPAVDEAIAQQAADKAVNVADGITELPPPPGEVAEATGAGETPPAADPHVWLDPTNMSTIGTTVSARLGELRPDTKDAVAANLTRFTGEMTALDGRWKAGTTTCANRSLVVSHEAFGYLAERYDFTQVGISGLSPDAEPSPSKVAEVTDFVRKNGVRTIYFETLVDPKVAQTVAQETGATTAVLDPLEGLADGSTETYVTVMDANLANVVKGQPCT